MNKKPVYTFYRLDFINCTLDYNYTIVTSIDEIEDYLNCVDVDLDNPESDASIKITGVRMTERQYDNFIKSVQP